MASCSPYLLDDYRLLGQKALISDNLATDSTYLVSLVLTSLVRTKLNKSYHSRQCERHCTVTFHESFNWLLSLCGNLDFATFSCLLNIK